MNYDFCNGARHENKLIIFDTTLRDGEQSPGASMTKEEKVRIAPAARADARGRHRGRFPAASNGDFESVKAVASSIKDSTVCGLARALERDIERAGEAIKPAVSGRIHTFIATSPIHMEKKLRMSPDQVVEQAVKAVKWARKWTDNVEFSPEDAGRSETDFLCRILEAVIEAGATTLNILTPSGTTCRSSSATSSPPCASAFPIPTRRSFRCIATMISAWRWRTPSPRYWPGRVRWNVPSMAWASGRAMPRWKRW